MALLLVMIEEIPDRHLIQGLVETHSLGWRWPGQETLAHTVWSGPFVCRMEKTEWKVQNVLPQMWDWSVTLKPLRDGESPRPLSSLTSRQSRKNFYNGLSSCSLVTWDSWRYYCFLMWNSKTGMKEYIFGSSSSGTEDYSMGLGAVSVLTSLWNCLLHRRGLWVSGS